MNVENILTEIKEKAAGVAPIGNTIKFDFGEQQIYVDGTGDTNEFSLENKEADCVLIVTPENLVALAQGKLNPMMAVMSGKVKIKGNMGVAMKLQSLFS